VITTDLQVHHEVHVPLSAFLDWVASAVNISQKSFLLHKKFKRINNQFCNSTTFRAVLTSQRWREGRMVQHPSHSGVSRWIKKRWGPVNHFTHMILCCCGIWYGGRPYVYLSKVGSSIEMPARIKLVYGTESTLWLSYSEQQEIWISSKIRVLPNGT